MTKEGRISSNIKSFRKKLDDVEVSYSNVKEIFGELQTIVQTLEEQVGNITSKRDNYEDSMEKMMEKENVKEMLDEEKVVPYKLFNQLKEAYEDVKEAHVWDRVRFDLAFVLCRKMVQKIYATKEHEIQKEIQKGANERMKKWFEHNKSIVEDFKEFSREAIDFKDKLDDLRERITKLETKVDSDEERSD